MSNIGTFIHVDPVAKATGEGMPSAIEIAEAVTVHGQFVVEIDPRPTQRLVDIHWAAFEAGRLIGCRFRVIVERSGGRHSSFVTIKVVPPTA